MQRFKSIRRLQTMTAKLRVLTSFTFHTSLQEETGASFQQLLKCSERMLCFGKSNFTLISLFNKRESWGNRQICGRSSVLSNRTGFMKVYLGSKTWRFCVCWRWQLNTTAEKRCDRCVYATSLWASVSCRQWLDFYFVILKFGRFSSSGTWTWTTLESECFSIYNSISCTLNPDYSHALRLCSLCALN